ncbi:MAG: hypothetical protein OEY64_12565 [Nitrospinota bacterium]|nr:hypothetical protein [Nitrospinota bacterium]
MRITRGLFIGTFCLFLVACGGEGPNSTADASVPPDETRSKPLTELSKASLSQMEMDVFNLNIPVEKCDIRNSPFASDMLSVITELNLHLGELENIEPLVREVLLLSVPPREEGTVGIYLCDDLEFSASTLFRSTFISNQFLERLRDGARTWGSDELFLPALSYVVFHEFAHAALNHSVVKLPGENDSGFPAVDRFEFDFPQEVEADRIAYNLMTATGQDLLGIVVAQSLDNL